MIEYSKVKIYYSLKDFSLDGGELTKLNSTQLNSTKLNSIHLNATQLNSNQHNIIPP